jgi:hypothetical protein
VAYIVSFIGVFRFNHVKFREAMLTVAAVAVAAIQWCDRIDRRE